MHVLDVLSDSKRRITPTPLPATAGTERGTGARLGFPGLPERSAHRRRRAPAEAPNDASGVIDCLPRSKGRKVLGLRDWEEPSSSAATADEEPRIATVTVGVHL